MLRFILLLTATLALAADHIAEIDAMPQLLIPAGDFVMGADDRDANGRTAEQPPHRVHLDAYWIDQHEVTNQQYADFLNRILKGNVNGAYGHCDLGNPACGIVWDADTRTFAVRPGLADHPVLAVSRSGAEAYAKDVGRRLPTEAEWERAARGTDSHRYPWGNDWDPARTNTREAGPGHTTAVGAVPGDRSPVGAWDMAGNAREWVKDCWAEDYYIASPRDNPCNTTVNGGRYVVRGGAWCLTEWDTRATSRMAQLSSSQRRYSGFRCARTVPEPLPAATKVGPDVRFYASFDDIAYAAAARGERRPTEVAGPVAFVDGKRGRAALLGEDDGHQYWIEYRSRDNIGLETGTITCWVQPRGWHGPDTGYRFFFLMRAADQCNLYVYCYPNGNLLALVGRGVNNEWAIASSPTAGWEDGQWHHVAVTWTPDRVAIHVDGQPGRAVPLPADRRMRGLAPSFRIGQSERWDPDAPRAQTAVDDFVIYDRALTTAEIAADMTREGAP